MLALLENNLMSSSFGEWLTEEMNRRGWNTQRLADVIGMSWQRTQRLLDDEPKRADGSAPQRRKETVEQIAKSLSVPVNEALKVAGLAPSEDDFDFPVELPRELQRIHAFQGRITEALPPGPVRDKYIKQLEAQAEMNWALIEERLREEGEG